MTDVALHRMPPKLLEIVRMILNAVANDLLCYSIRYGYKLGRNPSILCFSFS
uniref:Uncharacterized protein n=1 Tax=Arundo donax TaxID=35708 RepID=A0A0A9BXS9_ARUDO